MLTYSARPETVEEVQAAIQKWIGGKGKNSSRWFSFSKIPQETALRVWITNSASDVKFQVRERYLLFECWDEQLNLNLEKFLVQTVFEDKRFRVDIDPDPAPEHHFLMAALRQYSGTRHPAFYTRILRAVRSLEDDLPNALIDEAMAAPTDHMVMLEALSSAPWAAELAESDPVAAAKLRGLHRRQEMLRTAGGALSAGQVAEVLGLSRQAVDKRRSLDQLLALTQGRRGYIYPGFQFEEGKTLAGLEDVLKALHALDPWMQLKFFTDPSEGLGGKAPMEVLRGGRVNDVIRMASTYGEQGAV